MKPPTPHLAILGLLLATTPLLAQSKNIHESIDPYTGLRTLILEVATRGCPDDPPRRDHDPDVHLLFSAAQNKDGAVSYYIAPELDRGNSLNVRAKGTMDTLIDGAVGTFTTPMGSTVVTNYDAGRSYLHETVPFLVAQADIAKLSEADWFQFRINGPRLAVQRCTDAKHLRDLPEFLAAASNYAPPPGLAPLAASQQPHEEIDTSGEVKKFSLTGIDTYACAGDPAPGPHDPTVHLAITAEQRPDRTVRYFIVTDLTHGAALNLRSKDALDIQIDGVSQTFRTPHGSTIDAGPDASLHETIAFHVDRRDIVALSKSSAFQFRIDGPRQTVQRCTDASHLQDLAKFINTTSSLYDHPVADARQP